MSTDADADRPPVVSPWTHRWFCWYARRYLMRQFHALRLLRAAPPPSVVCAPAVFFLNHASWWDPLVAIHLADRFYSGHQAFGPIDAAALRRYPFMKRLGFFPVERGTARGARQFLDGSTSLLASPRRALWITPQGRFTDARERPVRFAAGLGHLAAHTRGTAFIPVALEYTWWFERSPEVLVAFGKPVDFPPSARAADLGARCESALAAVQDDLAAASQRRDSGAFATLLSGKTGVGGVYDVWRRFRSRLRGEDFTPRHHLSDPP